MIDDSLRRRYLLGEASEEECAAIELAFIRAPEELERMSRAEEVLIEDHIDGTLDERERQRFETHYLASPQHRRRLSTTRQLLAAASTSSVVRGTNAEQQSEERSAGSGFRAWLAVAAALLLIVAGAAWILTSRQNTSEAEVVTTAPTPSITQAEPAPASPAPPRVFAIMLSASAVRGADDRPGIVIPDNTDIVTLRLEAEPDRRRLTRLVVVVKTVGGVEIWRGAATTEAEPGVVARVDIPAARLPADDYIVALLETGTTQRETELGRYFLSVRTR